MRQRLKRKSQPRPKGTERKPKAPQVSRSIPTPPLSAGTPRESDKSAPPHTPIGTFIHLFTLAGLMRPLGELRQTPLSSKELEDVSRSVKRDSTLAGLIEQLNNDPDGQEFLTYADKSLEDCLEAPLLLHKLCVRYPAMPRLFAHIQPVMDNRFALMRAVSALVGSTALSQSTIQAAEISLVLSKYIGAAIAFASDLDEAAAKWWSECLATKLGTVITFRHPAAKRDRYNPNGISLFGVLHELTCALELHHSWPAFKEAVGYWIKAGARNMINDAGQRMMLIQRLHGIAGLFDSTKTEFDRLEFIQEHPTALIVSPEHQDAVARWLYASRYGKDNQRPIAKYLLKSCLGSRNTPGRYRRHRVDATQLRQAHNDLTEYIVGLNQAVTDCESVTELSGLFPDYAFLCLDPATGEGADEIPNRVRYKSKWKPPQPHAEAVAFISRHTGMKKTLIYELLADESKS